MARDKVGGRGQRGTLRQSTGNTPTINRSSSSIGRCSGSPAHERRSRILEQHYFGGPSLEEVADATEWGCPTPVRGVVVDRPAHEAFEAALGDGRLADAVGAYRGPFLDGFHVSESVELAHWIDDQRSRLRGSAGGNVSPTVGGGRVT
jgi:hypothetical protein